MTTNSLKIGTVLSDGNKNYRAIGFSGSFVTLVEMDTSKILLTFLKFDDVMRSINAGEWSVIPEGEHSVVDVNSMSDKRKKDFYRYREIMNKIQDHFGPSYSGLLHNRKDHFLRDIAEEYSISNKTLLSRLRYYLQSGFDETVLIDNRTTRYNDSKYEYVGRKVRKVNGNNTQRLSEEDIAIFDKWVKRIRTRKYTVVKNAWKDMVDEDYHEVTIVDGEMKYQKKRENIPSYRVFLRYYTSQTTQEDRDLLKMSRREQRNNKRLLLSSSQTNVRYPGQVVEVDEVDINLSLISEIFNDQTVGRPNVYIMADVLTRVILAVGIAYNQNSYVGLTNLFVNLNDDKVAYCRKYGIEIDPADWPSNIIPDSIRCDRGSDFKSDDILEVCRKLSIERVLEPGATASMKGIVENINHLIQMKGVDLFKNVGLITKAYDSNHHEYAMLNLHEYTRILILLVIAHNKSAMKNYKLSKDLIAAGVEPSPASLWHYYCENGENPMPIQNRDSYLVHLMKEDDAKVDRAGVHFLGRSYISDPDKDPVLRNMMYEQQNKKAKIRILYDPRIMDSIYRIEGSKLIEMYMNPNKPENKGFEGMSEQEVRFFNKVEASTKRAAEAQADEVDIVTRRMAKQMIIESQKPTLPSTKGIRDHRAIEKTAAAQENYGIKGRLSDETLVGTTVPDNAVKTETPIQNVIAPTVDEPDDQNVDDIADDFMDVL